MSLVREMTLERVKGIKSQYTIEVLKDLFELQNTLGQFKIKNSFIGKVLNDEDLQNTINECEEGNVKVSDCSDLLLLCA